MKRTATRVMIIQIHVKAEDEQSMDRKIENILMDLEAGVWGKPLPLEIVATWNDGEIFDRDPSTAPGES